MKPRKKLKRQPTKASVRASSKSNDHNLANLIRRRRGGYNYGYNYNYNYNPTHNNYANYAGQNEMPSSSRYRPSPYSKFEYIQFKLSDLINPNRNKTFIDNLYAQFQSNTNQISLFYMPPSDQDSSNDRLPPSNSVLLNDNLLNNSHNSHGKIQLTKNTNELLNDFYLNARYQSRLARNYKLIIYI
jgi:hypothetical protein